MSATISSFLLPLLRKRFSGRSMQLTPGQTPLAVFPSAHPDVGDLVIHDDGDELTLFVGNFTHIHFNCYDEGIAESERCERIAESLISYLQDLFADQVEMYLHERGGGTRHRSLLGGTNTPTAKPGIRYVWSGPLPDDPSHF